MTDYLDLGITTDPSALANNALDYIANNVEGWEPNEGNLEVILIEAIAPMAAALSEAAGNVPLQIFANYGTQLLNLPYQQGQYATVQLTFIAQDTAGYTIPAGAYLTIGGFGFATQEEAVILNEHSSIVVTAIAVEAGAAYNGHGQSEGVELVDALAFIQSVTANGPSSGGADAETDLAYVNRLATYLTLQAPRPITETDYAQFVLSADIPSPTGEGFVSVGRAVAMDGYNPQNNLLTLNQASLESGTTGWVTAGTNCTASQSSTQAESGGFSLRLSSTASGTMSTTTSTGTSGVPVTGGVTYTANCDFFPTSSTVRNCSIGIKWYTSAGSAISTTTGTAVAEVASTWTQANITAPAPSNAAFAAVEVKVESTAGASELHYVDEILLGESQGAAYDGTWYPGGQAARENERTVTVWVTNAEGGQLNGSEMKAIQAYIAGGSIAGVTYPGFREINFNVYVNQPDYTTVNIDYTASILPGYSSTGIKTAISTALAAYLNPATWGAPNAFQTNFSWLNHNIVRYNKIIGVIESVPGVDWVSSLSISSNAVPTPGTSDLTLVGPAPLPSAAFSEITLASTTSGSKAVTLASTKEMVAGMYVTGTGIPANTYISAVVSEGELTLSANATATATNEEITVSNVTGTIVSEAV
jgi:hypothetical protein